MVKYFSFILTAVVCAIFVPMSGHALIPVQTHVQETNEHYALAIGHYKRQDWERAVQSLGALVNNKSTDRATKSNAIFFLGESQVQLGKYNDAFELFEKLINDYPAHQYVTRAQFRRAEAAFFENRMELAQRSFEEFVNRHNGNPLLEYALPYLAEIYLNSGKFNKAKDTYQRALNEFPRSGLADKSRFGLAQAYRNLNEVNNAARFYGFVADRPGNSIESQEARLQLGTLWFEQQKYELADQHLSLVSTEKTDTKIQVQAIYWMGRCQMELGHWEKALGKFRSVSSPKIDEPLGSAIYFDGAVSAIKASKQDDALTLLAGLLKHFPVSQWNDDAQELQISIHSDQRKWQQVIELAAKFNREHPASEYRSNVQSMLARARFETGDAESSHGIFAELIEQATEQNKHSIAHWLYWKAVCEIELNRNSDAIHSLNRSFKSNQSKALKPYILLAQATAFQKTSQWSKAESALKSFLDSTSKHQETTQCRLELAVVQARQNRWADAKVSWQKWVKLNPPIDRKLQAAELLGELAFRDKEHQLARQWFSLLAKDGKSAEVITKARTQLNWLDAAENKAGENVANVDWKALKKDGSGLDAILAKAQVLEGQQHFERAETIYAGMAEHFPDTHQGKVAKFKWAKLCSKDNRSEKAILLLQQLTKQAIGSHSVEKSIYEKAWYELAWAFKNSKREREATQAFQKIYEAQEKSEFWADAALRIARTELHQKNLEKSETITKQILNRNPIDSIRNSAHLILFDIACAKQDFEQAEELVKTINEQQSDPDVRSRVTFAFAERMFAANKINKSKQYFEKCLALRGLSKEKQPIAKLRIGQCLGYLDQWKKSAELATDALITHRDFEKSYEFELLIGRYHASIAEFDQAREAYEAVIRSPRGRNSESAAMAQWLVGETYYHQQQYVDAIEAYYRVDSLYDYPKWNAAALLQAAKCHEKLDQWNHAVRLYEQIVKRHGDTEYAEQAKQRLNAEKRRSTRKSSNIR